MGNLHKRNIEAHSHLLPWRAISIWYSECPSVALLCQLAKSMRCIIVTSVACPPLPYFSTLSHKWHDFRKKIIDNTMCVLMFFTTFSETFPILRRIQRNIIINAYWHVKQPLLLSYFNENRVFSTYFRKTLKHNIPRKSLQWEPSCYMRTDGHTDMTELKVTFRNFADASKNEMTLYRQPLKET